MTYKEIKARLSKCELTLEKLKNGKITNLEPADLKKKTAQLEVLRESYIKQLKEAQEKTYLVTPKSGKTAALSLGDDEVDALKDADDIEKIKASDGQEVKEQEGIKFNVEETKAIAIKVGKSVAMALKSLGDDVTSMKAKNIEEASFEIYVQYKNGSDDSFSFYIKEDTLHLQDFSFDKPLADVGVKPSGEAIVNVDVLSNELQKHFKSLSEKVDSKDTPELKKLSKALKGSSQAHLDQKKKLDKLINTEDLDEAPANMYYIKVKKTDKASLNGLQDVIETWYSPVEFADIVDDDGAGNVIFYIKKEDWDPGMEDDIMGNGVQIVDTNMPLSEGEKEEDGADTDYAKRRKESDDYYQDPDYYKENKVKENALGFSDIEKLGSKAASDIDISVRRDPDYSFGKRPGDDDRLRYKYAKQLGYLEENEAEDQGGDLDVGHQDDEPDMLKQYAYDIATYASKLYKALDKYDKMDGEVDFPNWWQAKVIMARDYISKAQHYLEFEEKQPAIDQLALEENVNEDWGGSDQAAMNQQIHKALGSPKKMPSPFDDKLEYAVQDAVDFHWDDWPEYQQNREGLYTQAKRAYLRAMFRDTFDKMVRMFEPANEGKYKSDAQRKAIHAKKAEMNESPEQDEAVGELRDIVGRLEELGDEARSIIKEFFPNELSRLDAYGVFNFAYSNNRYDTTLGKFVDRLEDGDYDDLDDDDYVNEGTELYDRNGIQIKRFSGGQKGMMVQITFGDKYIVVPVDEFAILARAMQSVIGDLKDMSRQMPRSKNMGEGFGKTKKAYDLVVAKMKELAKVYKAGDKSVIDQLKDLTAKKKKLEAMLDDEAGGIGAGQELDPNINERVGGLEEFISLIQDRAADTGFSEEEEAEEVIDAIKDHYGLEEVVAEEKATYCGACGKTHKKSQPCPK